VQHWLVAQIREVDVLEGYSALDDRQVGRVRHLVDARRGVEQFAQPDDRRASLLQCRVLLDEQLDRCEESIEVEEEHDELRHVELVVQDHVAADAEQHGLAQDPYHERGRTIDGVDATGVGVGVTIGAHHMSVISDVAALAVVRGYDANPVERLGKVRQDVRDSVAREEVALLRRLVIPDRKDDEEGHHEQHGPHRELDVREKQDDGDDDHRESLERELADAVLNQLL
jgi:hypothetical protein